MRNIDPDRLEAGAYGHQVFDQKALGAAHIEHSITGRETKVIDHVLGHREPAAIIAIAAVAVFPGAVEIHLAVFFRDTDMFVGLGILTRLDVTPALRQRTK